MLIRAIPAAVLAIGITFSADHSAGLGLAWLGGFAIATGLVIAVGSLSTLRGIQRALPTAQGVAAIAGGVAAIGGSSAGLPFLVGLTAVLFFVTGAIELVAGLLSRGTAHPARDWIFLGAASVVFALAVLLVPVDYSQAITIPDAVVPNLTASVIVVGMLGAYAAIAAVYLVIAGLSLKWAKHPEASVSAGGVA